MESHFFNYKKTFILGCGNILFGDDGFGPVVTQKLLTDYSLPVDVDVIDAGTSVSSMLFDILLSKNKPNHIIIVDISDIGLLPGTIAEIPLNAISPLKVSYFSMHQFPSINILKEIMTEADIDVTIFVVQPDILPEKVNPGLSLFVNKAVLPMCETILRHIKNLN